MATFVTMRLLAGHGSGHALTGGHLRAQAADVDRLTAAG
jgi:hypothetical protein